MAVPNDLGWGSFWRTKCNTVAAMRVFAVGLWEGVEHKMEHGVIGGGFETFGFEKRGWRCGQNESRPRR
uniref:Uncharacterized protein n=1 Tax=Bos indicus x Bos taurus TaxID=30522 RepID=A0A4W2EMR6_BOBOX